MIEVIAKIALFLDKAFEYIARHECNFKLGALIVVYFIFVNNHITVVETTRIQEVKEAAETEEVAYNRIFTDYDIAMWAVKFFESFRSEAYWDVSGWSIGWGTKSKKDAKITLRQADDAARAYFNKMYALIDKKYPKLDRWTKLVVTCKTYNIQHIGSSLNAALKSGDKERIAKALLLYNKVMTKQKNGTFALVRNKQVAARRALEAKLLLSTTQQRDSIGVILRKQVLKHITDNE